MRLSQGCIAGFVILPSASRPHVRRRQLPPSRFSSHSQRALPLFSRSLGGLVSSTRAMSVLWTCAKEMVM